MHGNDTQSQQKAPGAAARLVSFQDESGFSLFRHGRGSLNYRKGFISFKLNVVVDGYSGAEGSYTLEVDCICEQ